MTTAESTAESAGFRGIRLLLDSADMDDVRAAADVGFVQGVTTNPKLLPVPLEQALDTIRTILEVLPSSRVFHQVRAEDDEQFLTEADMAAGMSPRVVLKVPATTWHFPMASRLVQNGATVSMTAVYSPAQYLLATAVGAHSVIPYVDRSARLEPDEVPVVQRLARVREAVGDGPRIIAASIKSPEQAVAAVLDGADAVTAPLDVLRALGGHPLSTSALDEFRRVI